LASKPCCQTIYGVSLGLRHHMPVKPQSNTGIAVPHLSLYDSDRCSTINQFSRYRMAESVKARERYSQLSEQGAQFLFPKFVR